MTKVQSDSSGLLLVVAAQRNRPDLRIHRMVRSEQFRVGQQEEA